MSIHQLEEFRHNKIEAQFQFFKEQWFSTYDKSCELVK